MSSQQKPPCKSLYDTLGEQVRQVARRESWSAEQGKLAIEYIHELTRGVGEVPRGLRREVVDEIRWQFVKLCHVAVPHGSLPAHKQAWYLELCAEVRSTARKPRKPSFARKQFA